MSLREDETQRNRHMRAEHNVTMGAEIEIPQRQAKECQGMPRNASFSKLAEARNRQGRIIPYRFQREHSPANCETIHFCCFKPPSLRCFVMAALYGN